MADPFSVTGSAVGVVSLGLQICKDLIGYINTAKDATDQIAQISRQMEDLANNLERLQTIVSKLDPCHATTANGASSGIIACAEALQKIQRKLAPSERIEGSKFRQQFHDLKERLIYPFKQDDILFWKDMVESIQQNLHTALITLLIDQQQLTHQSLMSQLAHQSTRMSLEHGEQTQTLEFGFHDTRNNFALMQSNIRDVHSSLYPMAADVSSIHSAIPELASQLGRMQAKLDDLTATGLSRSAIQDNVSEYSNASRRIARMNNKHNNTHHSIRSCKCSGRTTSTIYLRWPLSVSHTETRRHSSDCTYAPYDYIVDDLDLRFSMCSLALKRKMLVVISISRYSDTCSINPSLKCYRIVSENSPAFRQVRVFFRGEEIAAGPDAWRSFEKNLLEVLRGPLASPWDRLQNGKTLLHYICWQYQFRSLISEHTFYPFVKRLVKYMPDTALEKDDDQQSCVDYIIPKLFYGNFKPERDAILELIDNGARVTFQHHAHMFVGYNRDRLLPILSHDTDAIDCNDVIRVAVQKSETELRQLLGKDGNAFTTEAHEGYSPYSIFTINMEILKFWVQMRSKLDEASLRNVGSLESILGDCNFWSRQLALSQDVTESFQNFLIAVLLQQRRSLAFLAKCLPPGLYEPTTDRILDIEARRVYQALIDYDIAVDPALAPSTDCIYDFDSGCWSSDTADKLWAAGFRDLTSQQLSAAGLRKISPLLACATNTEEDMERVYWLLSKSADPTEKWPGSNVTVSHCLGWRLGSAPRWGSLAESPSKEKMSYPKEVVNGQQHFAKVQIIISPLVVFAGSSISITRWGYYKKAEILYQGLSDPGLSLDWTHISPTPRYPPEDEEMIREEDGFLLELLEELVEEFEEEYDRLGQDLQPFCLGYWRERMEQVQRQLRRQDKKLYGEGRRRIGVVMEAYSDDETDDDSDSKPIEVNAG
ncbi:hypothetical protein BCR34DRAFT_608103 [Clohesyomyces aquaticus]|uniref:Azaphilone pigments biosynthesis cluster protein L N-terminal domain-containing protein n=1 Tax=Clohesyomyces aquaticus TaxID=1231657 RepID=A0A1Y1YBM4_9PLEO|nr:hypothetical protein BCR34DRAFT_608103 [Clohesyomyces aquaticus]